MKKFIIKKLSLTNFKGHKSLHVEFSDKTEISGRNATGKSSVFDAFIWLLFGKDQFSRKDYEITPIIDEKMLEKVDSEVEAEIENDGQKLTLKRVYHQKWVRRRGSSEEVFDGCETLYYINDVPLKASEYKSRIDAMIDETVFKLITNPSEFLNLHWKQQREFLFQIAGTVSDAEIAASDPRFAALLDMVSGKSLDDYKKELSARKKKLKADLDDIQPRIDQTTRLMPTEADYTAIEAEIASIDKQIAAIELQMSDRSKAIREQYDEIQRKQEQISGLRSKQRDLVNAEKTKAQNEQHEANEARNQLVLKVTSVSRHIADREREIKELEKEIASYNIQESSLNLDILSLRNKWTTENEKEYQAKEGCLVCPIFGHECNDSSASVKHVEAQESSKITFNETKDKTLDEIEKQGKTLTEKLEALQAKIASKKEQLFKDSEFLADLKKAHELDKGVLANTPEAGLRIVEAEKIPAWAELDTEIKTIEATISEVKPIDNSDLTSSKTELTTKRDGLLKQLNNRDLKLKYEAEIKRLSDEGKNLAQQIADLEKTEFTIADFTRAKIEDADRRINRLFEIVKFKLYDRTIEGNEFETCTPTNKQGVLISATNTAEKINAGVDIINVLSRFYNVSAPIFCDSAESVNNYLKTEAQMVFLKVTTEPVLTISI